MTHTLSLQSLRAAVRGHNRRASDLDALGVALMNRGDYRRSAAALSAAIARSPDDPAVLHHLASSLLGCRRAEEAAGHLEQALRLDPGRLESWEALGRIRLEHLQLPDSAFSCFARAIGLAPTEIRLYQAAALCCLNGSAPEAIRRLQRSLPGIADPLHVRRGVGIALADTGRYPEAIAVFHDLLAGHPHDPPSLYGLGRVHTGLHQLDAAGPCFERAVEAAGTGCGDREILLGPVLHWSRLGDVERARLCYRSRLRDVEVHFGLGQTAPAWEGQDARGKTILLIAGDVYFGDAIQFVRFARTAKRASARVIVQAPRRIGSLLRTMPDVDQVVAPHDAIPPYDYVASAFSLLYSCSRPVGEMLGREPYLEADRSLRTLWRERIRANPGFRVGIVWRGSSYAVINPYACRSMPLELLRPLSLIPRVRLFSLQCGPGREELTGVNPPFPATDLAPDFPNTAAAILALDLIVTIDTSMAHLAGALGRRAYVMLPYDACFRWMMDRADTPWYSDLRLFRQAQPGDWASVVTAISAAVARLAQDQAAA